MKNILALDPTTKGLDDALRTRVVWLFSLALVIWAPVYSALMYGLEPHWEVVASTMTAMVLVGLSPFLLKRGASFFIVGNWLASVVYLEMLFVGAFAAYGTPPFFWLAVVPMMALVIAGLRSGIFWLCVNLVSLVGFYFYLYATRAEALVLSPRSQLIFEASVLAGLYVLVALLTFSYERARNLAVSQLKASEEWGRKTVENAADAILTVDAAGRISSANRASARIFGYDEQQLSSLSIEDLLPAIGQIPPDPNSADDGLPMAQFAPDAPPVRQPTALRAWAGHYYEAVGVCSGGETVPVEVAIDELGLGKDERFVAVIRNLTLRKKLEKQRKKALQHSRESFRALIENLPDGLIIHREGVIQYLNPAARDMTGYDERRQLVGRPVDQLLSDDEIDQFRTASDRAHQPGESPRVEEHHLQTREGEQVPVASVTFEAMYQNEKALISTARDMTETRQMRMKMMQMERMSAVGTLAAGVAHEINNPLTYVAANVEYVGDELREVTEQFNGGASREIRPEDYQDWINALQDAHQGADRIRKIVTDLDTYSQQREPEIKPIDPKEVIDTSISMASHEIKHRARLVRDFRETEPVLADPSSLGQVVLNLLINAAHAIDPGRVKEEQIRVGLRQEAHQVIIEVSDTGTGIPDDALPQIFDPFFTTKAGTQGTGLGLAICHNIMQKLGGDLSVETTVGEGTTFFATLPVARDADRTTDESEQDSRQLPQGKPRVLIIDDDPLIRRTLKRRLSRDYEIEDVSTSNEAFARLEGDGSFDAILCDLMMPEETGIDFFERLQQEHPQLADQVIFITGGAVTEEAVSFLETAPSPVLKKPFQPGSLHSNIQDILK